MLAVGYVSCSGRVILSSVVTSNPPFERKKKETSIKKNCVYLCSGNVCEGWNKFHTKENV